MLYGWAAATILAFLMQLTVEAGLRRPLVRVAYNSSVYAGRSGRCGGDGHRPHASRPRADRDAGRSCSFYAVDLVLVALVARSHEPFRALLSRRRAYRSQS